MRLSCEISKRSDAPEFAIQVMKDPEGANLDRVQVIKGWIEDSGEVKEKVFEAAWAGDRSLNGDGKLIAIGYTVNLETGKYENSIGAVELKTIWKDPEFDPSQSAFYYVRVLEIPTPRYSLFDAIALGIDVKKTGRPATIQERAYSSPIWYSSKQDN